MTPSCSSISYFPSAQTRNSRNGPTAAFPEDSIPAHAGKTTPTRRPWCGSSAHPRSRGENQQRLDLGAESRGSSPLTRGKPDPVDSATHVWRLIPAHAGKTLPGKASTRPHRAHPRSRGENFLTALDAPKLAWLIPAHAGKTGCVGGPCPADRAHPRSRGENNENGDTPSVGQGSSPLTRGKRGQSNC